ncbi:cobalamin B12-binding domain-containing protein [Variovorax sp. J22R133]|uniref:cobalamin B12-binding domain-containing protein n=1 Tax=Variovorax brevis TaxID=3053503 RepID=UPI002576F3B8|nr:cobalamin B12-binding domain-containing protein [Variovorax sp. J22R133]MDM0113816.1 cobalamin B12-binding domain-containing protein [Variovorax sp. J22R133]
MPRLAREALDPNGLNQQPLEADIWAPPPRSAPIDRDCAPHDRHAVERRQSALARTLELDIIPRLVRFHRAVPASPAPDEAIQAAPSAQDIEDFVQLVLARDAAPSQAFVDVLAQHGTGVESIYLDLLAPAAQHLNYLWTQDLCEFTQVTLGLARLQRLAHELSPGLSGDRPFRGNARRVLLLPVRGEQPTPGLAITAEFFHHAGWEVECGGGPSHVDAADIVRTEWFDILGLCAGSETKLENLRGCIHDVRVASRNRRIGVLVGGPIFVGHAERVKFVGADACGLDGKLAPAQAERLVALRTPSH